MFGMFKNVLAQQPQQQAPQVNQQAVNPGVNNGNNPTQMTQNNNPQVSADPSGQQGQQQAGQAQQAQSPIDMLAELMQTPKQQSGAQSDYFNVKPEELQQITSAAQFNQGIDPEMLSKAQAGDVKSLMSVQEQMMRNMMGQMLQMTVGITKHGVEHGSSQLRDSLPKDIARRNASESLLAKNPMAKPFADMIIPNLQSKNPHWSPEQLAGEANKMLEQFMQYGQSQQQTEQSNQTQMGNDWESFFN